MNLVSGGSNVDAAIGSQLKSGIPPDSPVRNASQTLSSAEKVDGPRGDIQHADDFLDAIRNDRPLGLNAEILEGHRSTLLCHLGNIAYRTGRTLKCDSRDGHVLDDPDAMKLWKRDYEPGWEPAF